MLPQTHSCEDKAAAQQVIFYGAENTTLTENAKTNLNNRQRQLTVPCLVEYVDGKYFPISVQV